MSHDTDVRHLRDPSFLAAALEHRTARTLFTLARRLRKHTRPLGAFEAWNRCLAHVLALSRAYIESVVHKCFLRAVEGCVQPEVRRALRALADTFALSVIAADPLFRSVCVGGGGGTASSSSSSSSSHSHFQHRPASGLQERTPLTAAACVGPNLRF